MRRILSILLTLVCTAACAQTGMHISQLFEGKIVPKSQMVETSVRGKTLSKYKLSFFHSVRFKADDALVKKIDHLAAKDFVADSEKFLNREPDSRGRGWTDDGRPHFTQMYELAPRGSTNRYLCYKAVGNVMTVIYLEGSVPSLSELQKFFKE